MTIDEFITHMAKLFHTSEVDEYDFLNKTAMKNLSIHLIKLSNAVWDNKEITDEFIDSIIDKHRTAVNIDKTYVQRLYKEKLSFDDYKIDDDIILSFIDDIIQMPLVQRKISTYIKSAKYEYNTEQDLYEDGLKDVNVLLDNNDKIGDGYELSKKFDVDVCTRDKPFVYLNGEMVYGDPGSIHSTTLNKILDDPSSIGYRPRDAAGIPSLDVNTPIAFGHIYKDLAFIETYDNCSIDDIVNTLTGINKVYDYNAERHLLKRVANSSITALINKLQKEFDKAFDTTKSTLNIEDEFKIMALKYFKPKIDYEEIVDLMSENDITQQDVIDILIDSDALLERLYDYFLEEWEAFRDETDAGDFPFDVNEFTDCIDSFYKLPYISDIVTSNFKRAQRIHDIYYTEQDEDGLNDVSQLIDNDDDIGDNISITDEFDVDWAVRDYPFVYLNGEILEGRPGSIHQDILQERLDYFNMQREQIRFTEEIPNIDNNTPIAFGHIYKNMAFIETCENCSANDVKKALDDYGFNKIYDYQITKHNLQRLAKLKKIANIQGVFGSDKVTKHNGMAETFMFDLSGGDKAFINIYHDALDDLLYAELQVEDKDGYIIDNQVLVTDQDHDKGITCYSDIKYQLEQRHKD